MPQNPALSQPWKESGIFSPVVFAAPVVTFLVSIPLAAIYALVNIYVPIVGIVTVIALAAFAGVSGFVGGLVVGGGRSRNSKVTAVVSFVGAVLGLYSLWVLFLFFLMRQADQDPSLIAMFLSPGTLFQVASSVAESGWFTIKGSTPSGALLWIIWLVEAVVFVVVCVFASFAAGSVYWCEACQKEMASSTPFETTFGANLKDLVKRGAPSSLEKLMPDHGASLERLKAHQCAQCGYSIASVDVVTKKVNSKGEIEETASTELDWTVVGRDFISRAAAQSRVDPAALAAAAAAAAPAASSEPSEPPSSTT